MSDDKKKNKKDSMPPQSKPKQPSKETAPTPDDNNPNAQYENKDEA